MPAFQCQICYLKCHNQELLGKHCYEKHWNQAARVAALLEKQVTNSNITTQASASVFTDPSLQIMTKDGQRLAAYKPKAPKTDKQKAETRLMRVLKACDECRRRKSKCDPSHKRNVSQQLRGSRLRGPKVMKSNQGSKKVTLQEGVDFLGHV